MRKTKVLIVDNYPVVRLGIKALLEEVQDVEAVGEAQNAKEALSMTWRLQPDVVVLDCELGPEESGLEVCRRLKSNPQCPKILFYTAQNSREDVAAAALAGADAYLYKGTEHEKLPETISRTCDGERIWLLGCAEQDHGCRIRAMIEESGLTGKESEILALVIARQSNQEIADELCLSLNTVKTHMGHILKKLGVKSRKQLFEED